MATKNSNTTTKTKKNVASAAIVAPDIDNDIALMDNGVSALSYNPTDWVTGDIITAARLNKAEQGIADAYDTAETANTVATNAQTTASEASIIATNAQSSAETAQTTAENAVSAAETAQTAADSAQQVANQNSSDIAELQEEIEDLTETGGEPNKINTIQVNGVSQEIVNKTVDITIPTKVSDLENDAEFATTGDVANAIAEIVANAPDDLNTLKEIADWIEGHADSAAEMNTQIKANASDIEELQSLIGSLPSSAKSTTVIAYVQELANAAQTAAENAQSSADSAQSTADQALSVAENITVPTKTSELDNDSGFITSADLDDVKTIAENASATATSAQSTADSATSAAATAQSTAESANSAASNAASAANEAQSTANAAQSAVDSVKENVEQMAEDIEELQNQIVVIEQNEYDALDDSKNSDGKTYYVYNVGTLDDCTWQEISELSNAGVASSCFAVGDRKGVELNGTVGALTFSHEVYYVYILGFNHNAELEGNNTIHFQFGFTNLENGAHIAFADSNYGSQGSSAAFRMNTSNTNSGGWASSYMRSTIIPEFEAALPEDLQAVLKTVTKYTDNSGGSSNTDSHVTATEDKCFLLSEFEVQGSRTGANQYERNYQGYYEYYSLGNSKIMYQHSSDSTTCSWWTRSAYCTTSTSFCYVNTSGGTNASGASYSRGFAPSFII